MIAVLDNMKVAKRPIKLGMALAFFLLPEILLAVPNINTSATFVSADAARANTYMDSGGVWNGSSEVTNSSGDRFRLVLTNTAVGAPPADVAFDLSLSINVPGGFRLPFSPNFPVSVIAAGGGPGCVAPVGVTASQAGGVGTPITLNLPANTNLSSQNCSFTFELGLTTRDSAPFVAAGNYPITYNYGYNEIDDTPASRQNGSHNQSIEVRSGDVIVVKTAVPNPGDINGAYADGETAEWSVSIFNNGTGGTFAVQLTDTLNANFNAASLQLTPPASPPGTPFPVPQGNNQYTVNYIAAGQQVDIQVEAEVAVPANAVSCPDLRNDATVVDRLGNTSSSFDAVELDLQDPLLDYTPNNVTIPFGGTGTVSFNVSNPGLGANGGTAKNISLTVTGLAGLTVANVSSLWSFNGVDTFTYLGVDTVPGSGDETLANGASVLLQFDLSMATCGGPTGGTLNWTPRYENICGTVFSPPLRSSTYTVSNSPTLGIDKSVTPGITNFGQPVNYSLDLTGTNVLNLPTVAGNNNDWTVSDTLPPGVINGVITTIPAGTEISVNGGPAITVGPIAGLVAGDLIEWRGDRDDLSPSLPTVSIDFIADNTPFCPPTPPITVSNTANLTYPSCSINASDAAAFQVNDSPISSSVQNLSLVTAAPFQTGRPDTNGVSADEANEGDHLQFETVYRFDPGSGGTLAGSSFVGDLGASSLAGNALSLIASPAVEIELYGSATATIGVDPVIRSAAVSHAALNNAVGTACGGGAFVNGSGGFCVPDIDAALSGSGAGLDDVTLVIRYTATAPEGVLDALHSGLPVGGINDPNKDNNIGLFTERATISVNGGPNSCTGGVDFTQGITGIELTRAAPAIGATINSGNVFDVCGPVNAVIDIAAPPPAGLSADNIRILIDGSNYTLPNNSADFTYGGGGNLSGLTKNYNFAGGNVEITVTPDTDNLTGDSSITFPVQLLDTAQRNLSGTLFYDSRHTSPDFAGEADEDYSTAFSITPAAASANLEVEFFPPNVILGDPANIVPVNQGIFTWRVRITNVGTNTVDDYIFSNEVPAGFAPYSAGSTPNADQVNGQVMIWESGTGTLPVLAPGASTEVIVAIALPQGAGCNVGNPNITSIRFGCNNGAVLYTENGPNVVFPNIDLALQHRSNSYCELCRDGTVELLVRNEGASDLYDISILEDLSGSGLEYVPNSTEVLIEGSGAYVAVADHGATTTTQITWDETVITELGQLFSDLNGIPSEMVIRFRVVAAAGGTQEDLLSASRNIQASATFDLFCGDPGLPPTTHAFQVPLRQPQPQVEKQGRNYSARQTAASYGDTVFGGTDDIVVWRVDVTNSGALSSADLEDLLINDIVAPVGVGPINFNMQRICPSEAAADAMAASLETGSAPPAACVVFNPAFDVDDPFGNPNNDEAGAFIDVARGAQAFIYYIGTIQAQCTNDTNTADVEWGCEVDAPPGGINESTPGVPPGVDGDDTVLMSTAVDPSGVGVVQTVTGFNAAQPLGTKGIVTVTVSNNSGGTIRNLVLDVDLPTNYEIDTTSLNPPNTPLTVTPAFGTYPGIVDDYTLGGSAIVPQFSFTSSTSGSPNQVNLLRNGDQLQLIFNIIRVRPFDATNNPEVRVENSADGTDPDYAIGAADDDNRVSLDFNDTCVTVFNRNNTINTNINPEDLDININPADPSLFFILSDPAATLDLDVLLSNNGGHDATDYDMYVTVGHGIEIISGLPAGCVGPVVAPPELGAPPAQAGGILPPEYNPADSDTYRCVLRDPLPPGGTDTFSFTVQRTLPIGTSGDLTFRADVLGRTTSSDGVTAPPGAAEAGYPYYSKDNILARIIGFNLFKRLPANCSEDNPPPVSNSNVQIGEECTYQVEASWFGFATPGFGNIQIRNARIYEGSSANNPPAAVGDPPDALDGQGFINIDTSSSTIGVTVNTQNPPAPAVLSETGFMWLLNNITSAGPTEQRFIADVTYRNLNDPLNSSAAPNVHDALRTDEVNASFDVFFTGNGQTVSFNENSSGYPPASLRTIDVTITEPNVVITKEVCNFTRNGGPCQPGDFQASPPGAPTVFGDSDDVFVYRLTLLNQAAGTAQRAPAYDLVINDDLDALDQMTPQPFNSDGLDNDGDGLVDGADPDGEGSISDVIPENGTPAQITFSGTHSTALQRLNAGASVELFYSTRLTDTVVPTQQLSNSAAGSYDSLAGANGSQSVSPGANGTLGGARIYNIAADQAMIEIDNVTINPGSKEISNTSRRAAGLVPGVCGTIPCLDEDVVIGEEVEVELEFTVPVSTLNGFTLVDNLPAGLRCIEADDVVLPAFNPPGVDPGFTPGGTFSAATCDADSVSWNFGNQRLVGSGSNLQYTVTARFIARVENSAVVNNNDVLGNGGASTDVFVTYRDIANTTVNIAIEEARLTVQEPLIVLTKNMGENNPAPPPLVNVLANADAGDRVRVEVIAQNSGASPVYDNLRILDDLSLVANLTYAGNVGGTHLPDAVDTATLGANRPIFRFNSGHPIYPLDPGETLRFSFDVLVSGTVQPLEVLDNTLSAAWTSLPNNSVALNAGGSIGADGAADGMRIGVLPNAADPINDYEAQGTSALSVPPLVLNKTDLDPAVVPTIGARKHYRIVVDLPEGVSQNVIVRDDLAAGDTSLILENQSGFDISYQCRDIASINGTAVTNCSNTASLEAALIGGAPADEAADTVSWNFGTVITQTENDIGVAGARNPQIVIDYYARVANNATTFDGQQVGNAVQTDFRNGEDGSTTTLNDTTVPVVVVEPDLQVNKSYIDLPAPYPPGSVVQGLPADFEVQVENIGNSTAWDVTIDDRLPNQTDPIPPVNNRVPGGFCGTTPTILSIEVGGRPLVAGSDYSVNFTPPASPADLYCRYVITLTPSNADDDARIDAGEILTVRYRTTPDIGTPNAVSLTNVAGATEWFSLNTDGVNPPPEIRRYTRNLTLAPDPNPGTVGIDDHQDAVTVLTQSPIIDVTKSVENLSTGQSPALTVAPGETLRYTLLIENSGPVDALDVRVLDDVDALNILNFADGYFENSPAGTLRNITVSTAATDNSLPSGGSNAAGLLDLSAIAIPAGGSVTITFDVDLEDDNTPLPKAFAENQARVELPGFSAINSNITQTEIIGVAADFIFEKIAADLSGDPDVLAVGDTLRYTLRIKNIGNRHAVNTVLVDQIPANTAYVPNSTRLNGSAVADAANGVSPLSDGLAINSPDVAVSGFMTANADLNNNNNVALVTFEVTVNAGLINSTIISNQGILTGQQQALAPFTPETFTTVVSDDPSTPDIPQDPTQNIVGSGVNLDALKTVAVVSGGDAIANTGETLRYTIVIANKGNLMANNVRLRDTLPAGTTFVGGSVTLNGAAVPDNGSLPLMGGLPVNSTHTGAAPGEIAPGEAAIISFEVTITAADGTVISNQGMVLSNEQPDEPTDADGNDENGDQSTRIIVGSVPDLNISKEVLVVGGGVARAGGQLEYVIRIENNGSGPATNVVLTDEIPAGTTYVNGSAQLDGLSVGSLSGNTLTASIGDLQPSARALLRFRVQIDQPNPADNRLGEPVENTATVTASGGLSESDSANIDIGGAPGVANIGGRVWLNLLHDNQYDTQTEPALQNWRVRVYVNNNNPTDSDTPVAEVLTDEQGSYSFNGLAPVDVLATGAYTLTFSVPADPALYPSGSNFALGRTLTSVGVSNLMRSNALFVTAGRHVQTESLPVDPTGVIYNSVTREPVQGARVSLLDGSGTLLPAACFDTPAHLDSQQGQITGAEGFYRFDVNFGASACPASASNYAISVETPDADNRYTRNISAVIPPDVARLDVNSCPDGNADRLPSPPPNTCEIQENALAPDAFIPPGNGTRYFLDLNLQPSNARLFNNHIPVDLDVGFLVSITKQTPLKNVVKGQLVPYVITVNNEQDFAISALEIRDFFPPGFKYIEGSATIDGEQVEPQTDASTFFDENLNAGTLTWNGLFLQPQGRMTIKLLLVIGSGVGEGEYVNRAQAFITGLGNPISEQASATVRVIPDPTFDCSDIIGKVFDDKNRNGYQDQGEPGIAGARVTTARGLLVTTDRYGRFHIVCPMVPNAERGSSFILKLDERSLPSGYRVTTENPRVQRLTRGKAAKFNFGVTLHKIVRLDLADAAFEDGQVALRSYWAPVYEQLFEQLQKGPSILRLSYLGDAESETLAQQRVQAIKADIEKRWEALSCCYNLLIEIEIFWRRGEPARKEQRP